MILVPPWSQPGWFGEASTWIRAELDRQGIGVTGPIEQPHIRQWSTVLSVPTTRGSCYFKAGLPVLAREPAVVRLLLEEHPDVIVPLWSVDVERGWMLMPDGGERLRTVIKADRDLGHYRTLLPRYAQLQIASARAADKFLAAGAVDRRLAILPSRYEALISDAALLRLGAPDGIKAAEQLHLRHLASRFGEMCAELAALGVPEALDHSDLHDGNILFRDGHYYIFDWGDACITHPFCSLNVVLVGIENTLGLEPDVPAVKALIDLYLDQWTQFETRENLRRALELAGRIGMINRALTWQTVLAPADEYVRLEYAVAIPEWLREFIKSEEDNP